MARTDTARIANDHFKRRWEAWLWVSVSIAVFVHFLVFSLWPDMVARVDVPEATRPTRVVEVLPKISMPEQPRSIARPAIPKAGAPTLSFDATITPSLPLLELDTRMAPPAPHTPPSPGTARAFTPFTVAPVLRNEGEIRRVLQREYPPLLKESGIGGVVTVWAFVGLDGRVAEVELGETSGYDAMDAAALEVAGKMRFTPAQNRDKQVPVWVSIPITFQVGRSPADSPIGVLGGGETPAELT